MSVFENPLEKGLDGFSVLARNVTSQPYPAAKLHRQKNSHFSHKLHLGKLSSFHGCGWAQISTAVEHCCHVSHKRRLLHTRPGVHGSFRDDFSYANWPMVMAKAVIADRLHHQPRLENWVFNVWTFYSVLHDLFLLLLSLCIHRITACLLLLPFMLWIATVRGLAKKELARIKMVNQALRLRYLRG